MEVDSYITFVEMNISLLNDINVLPIYSIINVKFLNYEFTKHSNSSNLDEHRKSHGSVETLNQSLESQV